MIPFHRLPPKNRKRHLRLLREVQAKRVVYVRGEANFRMAERLHKAGMLTACPSKNNLFFTGRRPFRELALYASPSDNTQHRPLPRR